MIRKKSLVLVSHCVLNQNSVINGWERAQGGFNSIIKTLINQDIGLIQLPCPELIHLGCNRPPMTKEAYSTSAYIDLCTKLANDQLDTLIDYKNNGYNILGLIGIENSPTCDTLTNKGVFMEIFLKLCSDHGINLKSIDIKEDYMEGDSEFHLAF